jgi:alkylation response protein AidB-like acyl-CoA dehydrogenase
MDFKFSESHEAFRQVVRQFLREALPPEMARRTSHVPFTGHAQDQLDWLKILNKKGWSVPTWPVELGGTGWDAIQLFIFDEECYAADAPPIPWSGLHMVGPILYTFGSEAQKAQFLPAIREGHFQWAQGFSEPSAGSDLASLRTRADIDGDDYIVNGQKIWTSRAHLAKWGFFLVKTDTTVKPQRGISFLLIDLSTPGVTIRPIPQIDGGAHVCEVFLENVRVPRANLVGEPGAGWTYGKFLLDHERTASAFIFWNKRELTRVKELAAIVAGDGSSLMDDPVFRSRLARLQADVTALEWSVLRVLAKEETPYEHTAVSSALKIRGSELQQRITELQLEVLGARALRFIPEAEYADFPAPGDPFWAPEMVGRTATALITRATTIYGGSKQIQKNLIAKLAFGL